MRPGARLGVDVGTVRVGVATCDPGGVLATPLETIQRAPGRRGLEATLDRVAVLAGERDTVEVVVGLPRSLSGGEGPAARSVREVAGLLARALAPLPVRLVDERLTTAAALRGMRAGGVSQRRGRAAVDQAAAVEILQHALDSERTAGAPPGETVEVPR